jgi:hypothetical protein
MSAARFSLAVLVLASGSCVTGPTPVGPLDAGTWGGEHVLITVASASATFEFDCAHGSTDAPITLDRHGHFRAAGLLVTEGGPVREPPEAGSAVLFEGDRRGRQLDFSVTRSGESQAIGHFTAVMGAAPRLFKCL